VNKTRLPLYFLKGDLRMSKGRTASNISQEEAGLRLKSVRERLNLRFRDVEEASNRIAALHKNDEFCIAISRLADMENKGVVPTLYRLYTLCAIYKIELTEVLDWYGITLSDMPADSRFVEIDRTHLIGFRPGDQGEVVLPLSLDPNIDVSKTTFLSRAIQRWGRLPLMLLSGFDLKHHSYGYIGTDDWTMYPLLQPGSFVMVDQTRRKIVSSGWTNEFERPIYLLETRRGYSCGWCSLDNDRIILQPHPASGCEAQVLADSEAEVVGQITGVAMRLDQVRRRRVRA
jgi:transcriptional regulator with XRE-family HTH domain